MTARVLRPALLALAITLFAAPAAHADATADVGIEDEGIELFTGEMPNIAPQWHNLGVDYVRVQAFWDFIAPSSKASKPPSGFNAANPKDPQYRWGELDNAINLIRANGMKPMVTINQVGPVWASTDPRKHSGAYKVDPKKYAQFATAVAKRYSQQVDRYLLGNEPNQKPSIFPQVECKRGKCEQVGGSLYRNLVNAGYPAIKRADPTSLIIVGELAPIGGTGRSASSSLKPLPFLRSMACVDKLYKPIRTGMCKGFQAPRGDAFGYHPYQQKARPDQKTADPELAKLGDTQRLLGVLDKLTGRHRLIVKGGRFNLYFTEFAYETTPAERRFGVSPALQAQYLQQSAYIVWSTPRLKLLTQYQWFDEVTGLPNNASGSAPGFQSGLLTTRRVGRKVNHAVKPSLAAFPAPFFVDTSSGVSKARFWGQVRPGRGHRVTLQQQVRGAKTFSPLGGPISTSSRGYWARPLPAKRGANYRFLYTAPGGGKLQGVSPTFHIG